MGSHMHGLLPENKKLEGERFLSAIRSTIHSSIHLFAEDCILYRIIETSQDHQQLQYDLNSLIQYTMQWQMKLNPENA